MSDLEPTRLTYPQRNLYQALGRLEAKIDVVLVEPERGLAAKPASPPSPEDLRVTALAKAMGDKDYHFPTGSTVSLTFDEDDEIVATGLTLEGRFWSISDIVKLGLIDGRGAWLWHRYSAIAMVLPPVSDPLLRPHHAATVAGRPHL
jgi:hypothetical protein